MSSLGFDRHPLALKNPPAINQLLNLTQFRHLLLLQIFNLASTLTEPHPLDLAEL